MRLRIGFSLLALLTVVACSRKQADTAVVDTTANPQQHITIEPATGSPAYPDAKLVIVSPREGQVLKNAADSVLVVMQVTGTKLEVPTDADSTRGIAYSKQGQHVHVIIDDKPYMADYKNGQPFNVGVLAAGMHTIRAFPSYSWHESMKSANAFAAHTFFVGPAAAKKSESILKGPLLTYSRPKGTYIGADANKVLLDFYVTNATLSPDGYKVKLWIDGAAQADIVKWQPYFIAGLSKGKHTIKLQLVDAKGEAVPGAYNTASQEITVS
jgi:hypothetical protein